MVDGPTSSVLSLCGCSETVALNMYSQHGQRLNPRHRWISIDRITKYIPRVIYPRLGENCSAACTEYTSDAVRSTTV